MFSSRLLVPDAIHDEVYADLGARDRKYIQSMIEMHRRLAVASRIFLLASPNKAAWFAGVTVMTRCGSPPRSRCTHS